LIVIHSSFTILQYDRSHQFFFEDDDYDSFSINGFIEFNDDELEDKIETATEFKTASSNSAQVWQFFEKKEEIVNIQCVMKKMAVQF